MAEKTEAPQRVNQAVQESLSSEDSQALIEAIVGGKTEQAETPEAAAEESQQQEVQPEAPATAAPAAEGEGTGEPEGERVVYFGTDLTDLPPEKRDEIVKRFQEQDKFIQRLMQRKAAAEKAAEEALVAPQPAVAADPSQEAPVDLSDDGIAAALGIDRDDPYYEVKAQTSVPLARQLLQLQQEVQLMRQDQLVDQTVRAWNSALDSLEGEYGELPVSRDDVFEYAAAQGINSPEDAFWRIAGPAHKLLSDEATKARQESARNLKLSQGAAIRPRSSGTGDQSRVTATSVKEAVKEAAVLAAQESGTTWEEALRYGRE